ncbi:MAG: ABC transporter substrate-binding protein [Spirochaetales bacterium]|nr:ABC transporter substrate-binding protein [Spirochaetales bacterium]
MKKIITLLVCSALVLSMFSSCGGQKADKGSDKNKAAAESNASGVKDTLNIAMGDMPSPNPYGVNSVPVSITSYLTHSKLVGIDPDTNTLKPELALSWTPNEDNTVWTFKLRQNVKFQNGDEFTAKDVKFTFDYAGKASQNIGNPWRANIKEVNVIDDYTAEIVLNATGADFPSYCSREMLSKKAFETMEDDDLAAAIGTGPYKFIEHISGVSYSYERFDDFWGDPAPTRKIVFKVIEEETVAELALSSGDVDAMNVNQADIAMRLANNKDYVYYTKQSGDSVYMGMNMDTIKDLKVRKAIAKAINRDELVAAFAGGGVTGTPVYTFFTPSSEGFVGPEILDFDPDGAKTLLAEAGYKDGLTLQLYFISGVHSVIAEIIQAQLAEVGINVVLNERAGSGYSRTLKEEGGYDLYINLCGDLGGVLGYWLTQVGPGLPLNRMNYNNPEANALFEKAVSADYEDLIKYWGEMQMIFANDCPAVALIGMNRSIAGVKGLDGVKIGNSEKRIDFSHAYVKTN